MEVLAIIASAVIAVLSFLFGSEKRKRKQAETELEETVEKVEIIAVEKEAEEIAGNSENETTELIKDVDKKVNEALKEIHENGEKTQAEIYNEKVKGWTKVKR